MSVGSKRKRARRDARAPSCGRRSLAARPPRSRSMPRRSWLTRTRRKPSSSRRSAVASACPAPTSRTIPPPAASTGAAPRATAATAPSAVSASCGSQSRTSGWRSGTSFASTYGGFETTRSQGPIGSPSKRSPWQRSTASPVRAAFSDASASASGEKSNPVTTALGCSSATASAIAPHPVPTSSTLGAPHPVEQDERAFDEHLGLGPRDESPGVDVQRQTPEPPLAEDVLKRLASATADDETPGALELERRQRPIERHVELDPLQPEGFRKQPLGVEPRGLRAPCDEVVGRATQDAADGDGVRTRLEPGTDARHTPAASSERRRSSAWIASVNSSRSPSRIWSSRWTVSLMRWSVSRFSAKL